MDYIPSVKLHILSISSFASLNNPSFSRRFCIIQALASSLQITDGQAQAQASKIVRKLEKLLQKAPDEGKGI